MLIGLAAKNATILIVAFAKNEYERGKSAIEAAQTGAGIRLRPIMMTSLAFVTGLSGCHFGWRRARGPFRARRWGRWLLAACWGRRAWTR